MSNTIADIFIGIVNFLSGISTTFGTPFANILSGILKMPVDSFVGSFLITVIMGIVAWNLVKSTPVKAIIMIFTGALIFSLFASPPHIVSVLANQTANVTGQY